MKQLSFNNMAGLEGGSHNSRACVSATALYSFACSNGLGFLQRLAKRMMDVYCGSSPCSCDSI